jgi:hypothetical protein
VQERLRVTHAPRRRVSSPSLSTTHARTELAQWKVSHRYSAERLPALAVQGRPRLGGRREGESRHTVVVDRSHPRHSSRTTPSSRVLTSRVGFTRYADEVAALVIDVRPLSEPLSPPTEGGR